MPPAQHDDPTATQPTQQQQQHAEGPEHAGDGGSNASGSNWKQRLIRYSVRAIQALMLLELAAICVQPLLPAAAAQSSQGSEDQDDFEPADILMDYFTGRRGITALQLLDNKQLRQAVDNLVTEDYEELGVKDSGAEIRRLVEDIIRVRREGPRKAPEPERVGLGKLGPLRYRGHTPAASSSKAAQGSTNAQSSAKSS